MNKEWTKNETDYLVLNKDNLTSSQLAKELGRTKNSVIGKLNRLGLSKIDPRPRKNKSEKRKKPVLPPKKKAVVKNRKDAKPVIKKIKPANYNPVHMRDRKMSSECAYLISDHLCCGKPIVKGSYCKEHADICYRKKSDD